MRHCPSLAKPMLEKIEDDLRAGHHKDQGPPSSQSSSNTRRRPSHIPSPKFDGCWCFENQNHSRQTCPEFQAIDTKWQGSQGLRRSIRKIYKVAIKAVTSRPAETTQRGQDLTSANNSGPELVETYLCLAFSAPAPPRMPRSPPTASRNRYDDLTDSDDE